jgi:predicted O-methyltransferase YrrM
MLFGHRMPEEQVEYTLNSITIDSTKCISELCLLCRNSGTDKSVYTIYEGGHNHPYSVPYSLLFETMRNKQIKFLEIGVYRGSSLYAWRNYFSNARLYGFDIDKDAMSTIITLPDTTLDIVDASIESNLIAGLDRHTTDGELFDVILDDASHSPDHHKLLIPIALKYLKQGGILIIEDVYRDLDQNMYLDVIKSAIDQKLISFYTFIICNHELRYSGEHNNDKLLVMVRS